MACSQELQQGDLVAVSIAMEAAGSPGYITRGSIATPELLTSGALYIGSCMCIDVGVSEHSSLQRNFVDIWVLHR